MFSRGAVAVFALVVAEFYAFALTIDRVGLGPVLLGSLVAALGGAALIRRQFGALVAGERGRRIDRLLLAIAGLALIVPGLITGLCGLLLLIPPIRAVVGRLADDRIARLVPVTRFGPRVDIVDVDVVSDDTKQSAPPELS